MQPFRRPLIPCLICYVLGLWVAKEIVPGVGDLVAGLALAGCLALLGWTAYRRDATPLLLAACAFGGVLRMTAIHDERETAETLVRRLDNGAPRVIRGTVRAVAENDPYERTRLTLVDVSVTSGGESVRLPGLVDLSIFPAQGGGGGRPAIYQPTSLSRRISNPVSRSLDALRFNPGDRVRMLAALSEPRGYRNFFGHDHQEYLALRQVYATARVYSGTGVQREGSAERGGLSVRAALTQFRRMVRVILFRSMPEHEALLMEVLLFNDMRLLSEEDERIFRDSGTMHLFAVSGTHIAMLAFLLIGTLRAMRFGVRTSWTAAAVMLLFYVWMLDFVPPALRALLMLTAFVAGKWLGREVDGLSCLAFGMAMILLIDPAAAWQAGFILSVMGVVAILLFVPLGRDWFATGFDRETWRGWMSGHVLDAGIVAGAIALVLLPLQFHFFQQFNLLSPVANLVEGLLAGLVLASGITTVVAGLVAPPLADMIGAGAAVLMRLSHVIADGTAAQTWAILRPAQPPVTVVMSCYAVLFSGYYMVRRDTPEFQPKSLARLVLHGACVVLILAGFNWTRGVGQPLRIWFLDVGQGDSTLIQFPTGESMLVDAGHVMPDFGKMVVAPQLRALGIWPLDELVASHADADHIGGIPWLLRNHAVGRLVEGTNQPREDGLIGAVNDACSAAKVRRVTVTAGEPLRLDGRTTVEVLSPPATVLAGVSNNDQSVVLRIRHGRFTALLMADAEAAVEERLVSEGIGRCDVLKVGHHGSRTSSNPSFVAAVRPSAAVISCGRRSRFGHPHKEVVERFQTIDSAIYRTDLDGAVLVESDGHTWTVMTARGRNNHE